jgi:hsdS specificity protein of type I restriction-modification system
MGNKSIPRIRLDEFNNIWTKSKLGKLYEVYSGNTPSRSDNRNYQNGEIPWVKTTDLNNSIIRSNEENISVCGASKLRVLPKNSVLIAMYGGFNQIGRTGLLSYPATINQALAALVPVNEIDPNFLLNFLNFKKESWRNVAASSRKDPNITKNDVEKFIISFPSLPEQSAIGSLFRTLDDLLASYKDNLANYQALKATMLSKMFPKAGQTVPEIRLSGFEGDWEIKRADEIFKSVSKKNRASLPVLSASQIDGMVLRDEIGIDIKYDEATLNNYKIVKPGQFVIHLRSFQGGFALSKLEGITSPAYTIIDFIDKANNLPDFWNSILTSRDFIKRLETVTYGIRDGKSISFKDFSSLKFVFPEFKEQQAIGAYFSNLDNLINSHQEKISQLETLKKKLLQDMFI